MTDKKTAAFFDFDNTLLSIDTAEFGVKYMWKKGEMSFGLLAKIGFLNEFFKRDLISSETMANACLAFYKGRKLDDFKKEAEAYYHEHLKPFVAPSMMRKLEEHRAQGHMLVILSASVRYMLEPARKDLGFDHLICTDLELDSNGLLTGHADGELCLGEYKRIEAKKLVEQENIDLSTSYAYSDHHSDVPMLEMVGFPTAVEPNKKLRKIALERNWPIVGFE